MEKVTHYIDVRIGVDFEEVFNPKVIEGFKMALGVNDEGIVPAYSKMLVNELEESLIKKRFNHLHFIDASVSAIDYENEEVEEAEEQDLDEYMSELSDLINDEEGEKGYEEMPHLIQPGEILETSEEELAILGNEQYFNVDKFIDEVDDALIDVLSRNGTVKYISVPDSVYMSSKERIHASVGAPVVSFSDTKFATTEDDNFVVVYEDENKEERIIAR